MSKKKRNKKPINIERNPVAKHMSKFNKSKVFRLRTKYNRRKNGELIGHEVDNA